jgi:NADH-quinone oxidoreductase subunit G
LAESLNTLFHRAAGRDEADARPAASIKETIRALALELKAARTVRVVASANLSNEELFLARELFANHFRGEVVTPAWAGDPRKIKNGKGEWLVSTDAHPNSGGARRLGLDIVDEAGLARFLYGAADLTVILDPDAHPFLAGEEALQLLRVGPTLVFAGREHPIAEFATWVLPSASLACNEGTFTSSGGSVQRFWAAFSPPPGALPRWRLLTLLARELAVGRLAATTPRSVFELMTAHEKGFSGLTWEALGGLSADSFRERQHVG